MRLTVRYFGNQLGRFRVNDDRCLPRPQVATLRRTMKSLKKPAGLAARRSAMTVGYWGSTRWRLHQPTKAWPTTRINPNKSAPVRSATSPGAAL